MRRKGVNRPLQCLYDGHDSTLVVLQVAETCQLAVRRLEWLISGGDQNGEEGTDGNPYCSVDPAPPALRKTVPELRTQLLDESLPLFERYRAMFALRNLGTEEAVLALGDGERLAVILKLCGIWQLAIKDQISNMQRGLFSAKRATSHVIVICISKFSCPESSSLHNPPLSASSEHQHSLNPSLSCHPGLQCSSALFRHEIGYVLGQIQHPASIPQLQAALELDGENAMVRHECAEALGSIGKEECMKILEHYRKDAERVVKESCEVALDMLEYENGTQFQYADGLLRLQGEQ